MDEPIDESYLRWLYSRVAYLGEENSARTFWHILSILHKKEFVWVMPNDDNRVADGTDLRLQFCEATATPVTAAWMSEGCSFLEMLIALSDRAAFLGGGERAEWFWIFMENINLRLTDAAHIIEDDVHTILDRVIWRTYDENGHGGLFPLDSYTGDQRRVELWYQLNAYLRDAGAN